MKKENIISIQSQVFDGFCGNNIAAFVFRRRGHIPKILNTVQYYSKFKHSGVELNSQEVDVILSEYNKDQEFMSDSNIYFLTGYIKNAECVDMVTKNILELRKKRKIQNGKNNDNGKEYMNGHMDGHMDGYMDGYMNGYMNGHMDGYMNGQINDHMNGHMNGYMNGHMNGHMNGYMNGHMNGYINGHTNGPMNGHINGHTNGHINGHINGHTNGPMNGHTNEPTVEYPNRHINSNEHKSSNLIIAEGKLINEKDMHKNNLLTVSQRRKKDEELYSIENIINLNFLWICDPVMGDNGRLYVDERVVESYKKAIQYVDIITPNQYETELLCEIKINEEKDVIKCLNALLHKGVKLVIITSVNYNFDKDHLFLYVSFFNNKNKIVYFKYKILKIHFNCFGSGDLFSCLLLSFIVKQKGNILHIISKVLNILQNVIKNSLTGLELNIIENQDIIASDGLINDVLIKEEPVFF
ncbi:pyridoxal kinase [Plasmodium sp. gorilla clade G2]|uniref:pyridoxal kinase n=1 Tax=Plasmodium sp. gorilla clade G2 TaxID=880535 RepID=UPI000D220D10|nr:pyridoxal kinase [Plasmodium sp. gorilla clade G2]SOV12574.1 pyridoxal kinase [Plasmodium sp. gorilla clade G2]